MWCDPMCWFFWDATIFCNNFARWLQKMIATCDVMRCVGVSWMLHNFSRWLQKMIATLCSPNEDFRKPKNISDRRVEHFSSNRGPNLILTPLKKCSKRRSEMFFGFLKSSFGSINFARWLQKIVATVMWCVGFSGMLWSFVTTLQDDYKR
jgi:hypothetical protein